PDRRVDAAVTVPVVLGVVVMDHDLIAEEAGRFGPPVSNQGLAPGEFQLQAVAQESPDLALDVLGFPSRTGIAQQPIVRVTDVMQPPVARIVGVTGGELLQLPAHLPGPFPLPFLLQLPDGLVQPPRLSQFLGWRSPAPSAV